VIKYVYVFDAGLWPDQMDAPALKTCKVEDDLRWSGKRLYKHTLLHIMSKDNNSHKDVVPNPFDFLYFLFVAFHQKPHTVVLK